MLAQGHLACGDPIDMVKFLDGISQDTVHIDRKIMGGGVCGGNTGKDELFVKAFGHRQGVAVFEGRSFRHKALNSHTTRKFRTEVGHWQRAMPVA